MPDCCGGGAAARHSKSHTYSAYTQHARCPDRPDCQVVILSNRVGFEMGEVCLPPPKACRLPLGVRSLLLYFKICRRRLEVRPAWFRGGLSRTPAVRTHHSCRGHRLPRNSVYYVHRCRWPLPVSKQCRLCQQHSNKLNTQQRGQDESGQQGQCTSVAIEIFTG